MIDKSNRHITIGLLFLAMAALVLVPAASANRVYYSALTSTYGSTGSACETCHINSSGGGERNAYGKLFESQANHIANPSAALRAIGAPPGWQNTTSSPEATIQVPIAPITEPTKKSPGIGMFVAIGLICAMYIIRRRK
jgi:hypothetical protein